MRYYLYGSLLSVAALMGCDMNADRTTDPLPTDSTTPSTTVPSTSTPGTTTPGTTTPGSLTPGTSTEGSSYAPAPSSLTPAPNNTDINERDADGATKTPIDQDENQPDITRTAEIRKRVVARENLSTNAHNAKIITSQGKVTLRGPVESQAEKDAINEIAVEVAGAENVDNQLEVKTNP